MTRMSVLMFILVLIFKAICAKEHVQNVNEKEVDTNYINNEQAHTLNNTFSSVIRNQNNIKNKKLLEYNKINNRKKRKAENQWIHSEVLDDQSNFILRWQTRHQEILFRIEAKTRGYVGLGFSSDGMIENADIVIAWVDDRTSIAHLLDCHGIPKSQGNVPVQDETDNYILIQGIQNDTHTIVEFKRLLDTCDPHDYVLDSNTVKIIWAIHEADPNHNGIFMNDGEITGSQSIHLFGPPLPKFETSRNWDVTLKNFVVPDNMNTIYWCKVFKAPSLNSKHHIIGYEPILGQKHIKMVHHMIMHECQLDKYSNLRAWDHFASEDGQLCYNDMPTEWEKCLTPLIAWAVGSKGELFPENVGLPLTSQSNSYYMLEVHFDNPLMKQATDTTGLRLKFTSNVREHDGGIIITGVAPSTLHFIPPYQKEYKTAGYCSFGCTKEVFPKNGINAVSVMLHSHLAGRKLQLRHIRGKNELPPLAQDDNYDFNYQQSRTLSQATTILPGDGLITECTYSTINRNRPTLGGYSTSEEMCLAFILYYPKIELAGCYSIPPVKYFFENLGVKSFYGKTMTEIERNLLEGDKSESTEKQTSVTKPLFQYQPGDEFNPEANQRAILALQTAKEFSVDSKTNEEYTFFDNLIIKDPLEFRNKSFMSHLQNIPYNETVLTKKIEEYFYMGLHLTFCRKKDDTLAIKENVERLPNFKRLKEKENVYCSLKQRKVTSSTPTILINNSVVVGTMIIIKCFEYSIRFV